MSGSDSTYYLLGEFSLLILEQTLSGINSLKISSNKFKLQALNSYILNSYVSEHFWNLTGSRMNLFWVYASIRSVQTSKLLSLVF